ncbi:chorismate synthase [Garciella nitratireducens]|uniref:chorismate synthase n=1 Tax=Garciella nitratireducens TaxID=218205 RepID=UPI000DE97E9F|nr:chorismate synthase [Garciella nitratireducens]RBP40246.1 chorismate synthase [Garciella nitratireducens]
MSSFWGNRLKISIFGESHGTAIGVVIDGLPTGFEIDMDEIYREMQRRAPGRSKNATARKEEDIPEILSGYFNGRTTGTPLAAIIRNRDVHSKDYNYLKKVMRPGHADYSGYMHYQGYNDYRGGGHFSGRITAPLVFTGAICKQILEKKEIYIGSHIKSVASIFDKNFEEVKLSRDLFKELSKEEFPLLNKDLKGSIQDAILQIKEERDSLGGIVECAIIGIKAGIGNPFFDSIESILAHLMFSIPAVKGIEFGAGFEITKLKGSQANDEYYYQGNQVKTYTNNNGGIIGGISNGMPIVFRVAIKPTPSISKKQQTIDIQTKKNVELEIKGRHDPIIVLRAVPVIETVSAIGILDIILSQTGV